MRGRVDGVVFAHHPPPRGARDGQERGGKLAAEQRHYNVTAARRVLSSVALAREERTNARSWHVTTYENCKKKIIQHI